MRSRNIHRSAITALLAILVWQPLEAAEQKEAQEHELATEQEFMRVQLDEQGEPVALQTAIVSYAGKNPAGQPVVVDLVGVVHIGDKGYYNELNKLFEAYDAVLYELVAPEGTKIPKGGGNKAVRHPLTAAQRLMQSALNLDYQLYEIDYTRENFVHADMTPDEFAESMKDRNESFLKLFFRVFTKSAAMQRPSGPDEGAQFMAALLSKNRALRLKRIMSSQLVQSDLLLEELSGPEGSTIITERNKKALSVLKSELAAGKKRMAIFYGAGHLPDMDQRLHADFEMSRGKATWLTAWNMQTKSPDPQKPPKREAAEDDKTE